MRNLPISIDLPNGFLDKEVRCGYTVSKEMKEVWAVELDLLKQFQKVCETHDLMYFAFGGTLLGAIRHNGFIPWDDDIDVIMLREDFNKLCSLSKEFSEPYELQFYENTPGYLTGHAQLRNKQTTGVLKAWVNDLKAFPYNQGIFIDIFVLDAISDDLLERKKQMRRAYYYKLAAQKLFVASVGYNPETASLKRKLLHVFSLFIPRKYSYRYFYDKFVAACTCKNNQETTCVASLAFMLSGRAGTTIIERESLKNYKEIEFEFIKMIIEGDYDKTLRSAYGNYHEYVIGSSLHGSTLFDAHTSFDEWKERQNHDTNSTNEV